MVSPQRKGRATSTTAVVILRCLMKITPSNNDLNFLKILFNLNVFPDEAPEFVTDLDKASLEKMKVCQLEALARERKVKFTTLRGKCAKPATKAQKNCPFARR